MNLKIAGAPTVVVTAKNKSGTVLGRAERSQPRNMSEAVQMFGSKKRLVQFALSSLDIAIQHKLRHPSTRRSNGSSEWSDD